MSKNLQDRLDWLYLPPWGSTPSGGCGSLPRSKIKKLFFFIFDAYFRFYFNYIKTGKKRRLKIDVKFFTESIPTVRISIYIDLFLEMLDLNEWSNCTGNFTRDIVSWKLFEKFRIWYKLKLKNEKKSNTIFRFFDKKFYIIFTNYFRILFI